MPKPTKYKHLIKPLVWQKGPEGLYPFELFWMEGKTELGGFGGSFAYCFVTEETQFHPVDGMVVHPYDEVLWFGSLNRDDMLDLGAEVSIEIGEERELYTFDQTYAVALPKGTPHGPVKVKNVKRPFVHFFTTLDPVYSAQVIPASELKPPVPNSNKYDGYARLFAANIDPETGLLKGGIRGIFNKDGEEMPAKVEEVEDKTGMGYNRLVDSRGVIHSRNAGGMGPGNSDNIVWLFGEDLQNIEINVLWGHYSQPGVWHRMGDGHTHVQEEMLIVVS